MDLKTFLQSKVATVFLLGILALIMVVTSKLLLQKREVSLEISQLQARADKINQENQELSELIKYLNTTEYTEREAREKLNLKKEGEHVVVLPKDETSDIAGGAAQNQANYVKWFNKFFGSR